MQELKKWGIFPWITWSNKTRAEQMLFDGVSFDTYEEGWAFIYETDPEPEETSPDWRSGWYDDYYVELIDPTII